MIGMCDPKCISKRIGKLDPSIIILSNFAVNPTSTFSRRMKYEKNYMAKAFCDIARITHDHFAFRLRE